MAKLNYIRAIRTSAFAGPLAATLLMAVLWYRSSSRSDQCMILLPRSVLIIATTRGRVLVLRMAREPTAAAPKFSVDFDSEPLDSNGNSLSLALIVYAVMSKSTSTSSYKLGVANLING